MTVLLLYFQVTVSVTASFSYTTGESATETKSDQIRVTVQVLPRSKKTAVITATRYVVDVPYSATVIPEFHDGTTGAPYTFEGIYRGTQVNDIQVIFKPDVPL